MSGKTVSSPLVVVGRLLLLLFAAGAVIAAFVISHREDRAAGEPGGRYVCPMHPEVTSPAPGECPICRMDLEPASDHDEGATPKSAGGPGGTANYEILRRRLFQQDVRAPAWVEGDGVVAAVLYKDELATVAAGDRGVFAPSAAPSASVEIHLGADPVAPWDRSTSLVRFRIDGDAKAAPQGQIGWVRLPAKRREVPVVPSFAVLESTEGPYVLVASSDGATLTKRPVEIGRVFGGMAVVLSGLRFHERVLIRGAFLLDAERRLQREVLPEVMP